MDWSGVSLRPLNAADLPSLYGWQNDPELRDLMMGFRGPVQMETTAEWIHSLAGQNLQSRAVFGIEQAGVLVGMVQLHGISWVHRSAMLGLHVASSQDRKKGVGFIATSLLLDYAFDGLDLERISLNVLVRNAAAVQLYQRMGFQPEGVLRSAFFLNRRREDVAAYAMLRHEWSGALPREARRLIRHDVTT